MFKFLYYFIALWVWSIFILGFAIPLKSLPLSLPKSKLNDVPPRTIRVCCNFGTQVGTIVPFLKWDDIIGLNQIGRHHYLGDKEEGNGIIYTKRGGFLDLGHLRDMADWTAYLYDLLLHHQGKPYFYQKLGYEGGAKSLHVFIPERTNHSDLLLIAGKIAYDISIWHEIATWYGVSTVPFLPERFSSFSIEDPYSNYLGVKLGMLAIQSDLPYEQAMSKLLFSMLDTLGVMSTPEETKKAFLLVDNLWWNSQINLPSNYLMTQREHNVYNDLHPWLLPSEIQRPYILPMIKKNSKGQDLQQFYELQVKVNFKFPLQKICINPNINYITQHEFGILLSFIKEDFNRKFH